MRTRIAPPEMDTIKTKGQVVNGRQGNDWNLTVDTTNNIPGNVQAEYILDGKKIKIGSGRAAAAAKEVADDLVRTHLRSCISRAPLTCSLAGFLEAV